MLDSKIPISTVTFSVRWIPKLKILWPRPVLRAELGTAILYGPFLTKIHIINSTRFKFKFHPKLFAARKALFPAMHHWIFMHKCEQLSWLTLAGRCRNFCVKFTSNRGKFRNCVGHIVWTYVFWAKICRTQQTSDRRSSYEAHHFTSTFMQW